jgi:ATP-dependent DNA ligase
MRGVSGACRYRERSHPSHRYRGVAAGAALLKTKSLTIDGEAVVAGPGGLTDFEALAVEAPAKSRCSMPSI